MRLIRMLAMGLALMVPVETSGQSLDPALRDAIDGLYRGRISGDGDVWSRYVAPDYLITHPDGRVHNRTEEIAEIRAAGPGSRPVLEDERFRSYSDVVIYTVMRNHVTRATDVWIKSNSDWKIVSAQGSPVVGRTPR